jgi:tetratricopeptide (TPR) repeat protein
MDYGGDAMSDFIDVRYRDHREGAVDDVTLNELILTGKVKQFFRPSEGRWVDVDSDAIRLRESKYEGPERRKPLLKIQEQEPASNMPTEEPLTAQDWYALGFSLLRTTGDHYEAIRAFATAIRLDPLNAKAYLNRGMAYEQLNNLKQAYEDYCKTIQLLPDDARAYYMRGILLWRYGKHTEAIIDLNASAELGYKLAIDFFKRRKAYS